MSAASPSTCRGCEYCRPKRAAARLGDTLRNAADAVEELVQRVRGPWPAPAVGYRLCVLCRARPGVIEPRGSAVLICTECAKDRPTELVGAELDLEESTWD